MSDMARSPFCSFAFAQLVRRLRHTNARYNQIALQFRRNLRCTHHARRRAYRIGLRIDTAKARGCPNKYVAVRPPPVLDSSEDDLGWSDPSASAHATTKNAVPGAQDARPSRGDAYTRHAPLRKPEVIVRKRRRNGQPRVVLRLPPLKLQLNVDCSCSPPFEGPAPGAPRLSPCQLPEDDCGTEDVMHGSESHRSSAHGSDSSLNPYGARAYSGLCITIPPRSLKRKFQDVESDENAPSPQQPKRLLKARWDDSRRR